MQLSRLLKSLILLSISQLVLAHPLDIRMRSLTPTVTSTSAVKTATSSLPITTGIRPDETLNILFEGNQKFRQNNTDLSQSPKVMFISCIDNKFEAGVIFQQTGSIISQVNVGNQFSGRDANANSAIAHAIYNLHVKHIVVMGHYGCSSIQAAISTQLTSMDRTLQTWLKSIQDIFLSSKRIEIKKLRDSRKGKDKVSSIEDDDPGLRGLVEENVKESVKRLMNESILSRAYLRKKNRKDKDIDVYVHGFVFNEKNGEVKNLGVSFGPPGKHIQTMPFETIAKAVQYRKWGKPKAKAKKLMPTTSVFSTSTSSHSAATTGVSE